MSVNTDESDSDIRTILSEIRKRLATLEAKVDDNNRVVEERSTEEAVTIGQTDVSLNPTASLTTTLGLGPKPALKKATDEKSREYQSQVEKALLLVTKKKFSIRKSAKKCGVPKSTLHDIIRGKRKTNLGDSPRCAPRLFSLREEQLLVNHVNHLASMGYPVGRGGFIRLATESAIYRGKRGGHGRVLTDSWYKGFQLRWPTLEIAKPQKLETRRATATSHEIISKYFDELEDILQKYNLTDKPEFIFSVDETGFQVEPLPPKCIAPKVIKITTDPGATTSLLTTGSAAGQAIPPFLIYKGELVETLKEGAYPGSYFAISEGGWSNGEIFRTYFEEHFLKFLPSREPGQHALLLYDGHNSHISVPLIEFAKSHKIILFVLPPHMSHVLQSSDKGITAPMEPLFNYECACFMVQNPEQVITRYDMTSLISSSYAKAMTPDNLITAFRATGVYPLNKDVVSPIHFATADDQR